MSKHLIGLCLGLWAVMLCTVVYGAEVQPLNGLKVYIDAGHGGYDPGAIGITGVEEKELNLAIAKYLQGYLEMSGAVVSMSRIEDQDLAGDEETHRKRADMQARMQLLQESGAELMISIHQNSYTDSKYWGPQVFYKSQDVRSRELALSIQDCLNSFTAPECTRVIKEGDSYYILKNAEVPAVLVECGFITNSLEEELLSSPEYQKKVAWGIYQGIIEAM